MHSIKKITKNIDQKIQMEEKKRDYLTYDAGDIARQRLYGCIDEKLKGQPDTAKWEFINFLLGQAKSHKLDYSGYGPSEYQRDRDAAKESCRQRNAGYKDGEFRLPERKTGRR
jgi:hypothetical protein